MLELKKQSVLQLKEEAERRGGKGMNSGMSGDHRATAVSKSVSRVGCRFLAGFGGSGSVFPQSA